MRSKQLVVVEPGRIELQASYRHEIDEALKPNEALVKGDRGWRKKKGKGLTMSW